MARQVRAPAAEAAGADCEAAPSELTHWPVQLRLVPPDAPYLQDAALLVVADCVPFALADFHARFLRGRCVVVGCPKLDDAELHVQKLADILTSSSIRSLTVIRMEVPCCGGLVRIAEAAMARAGKDVPFDVLTVSVAGEVLSESPLHSRGLAPAAPPEAPG
jgi:hypothetical protein